MDISIVVCTYNRAESLQDTLIALQNLSDAAVSAWEVIVVDNNSSDETREVVDKIAANWRRLRYVFEPKQGLSYARNCGIHAANGEIVLFTDDDVLPERDWMEITMEGVKKYGADACGGYVAPIWETEPPEWLTERFHGFLAVRTDREDDYRIRDPKDTPYGANMAIRKSVLEHVGGFDTERGRKGKVLASGEDGEMFERILNNGYKVVFLGRSRVHHKVEAFRMTKSYIRRWRYQTSRNLAMSKGVNGNHRFLNIPLYLFVQLSRAVGRMLIGYLRKSADEAFFRDMLIFHFLGLISGLYSSAGKDEKVS